MLNYNCGYKLVEVEGLRFNSSPFQTHTGLRGRVEGVEVIPDVKCCKRHTWQ